MKAKWLLIGGAAVGCAVLGGIAAIFLVGRPGDPPAAGGGADVQANPVPAPAGKAAASTFWLEDRLPAHKFEYKYKSNNEGRTLLSEVYAGRRDTPDGIVYFVGVDDLNLGFRMTVEDVAMLAEFLENPLTGLPATLTSGTKPVTIRVLEIEDAFRPRLTVWFRYDTAKKEHNTFKSVYQGINYAGGTYPNGNTFGLLYQPKPFAELLRAAMKDIDTLKSYPAKH